MPTERSFHGRSLCVVGNINRDVKTAPLPDNTALLADGETSVASITETIGGGGANSAFAAASLGAKVAFLGKVGSDGLGERLHRTLTHHRISAHLAKDTRHGSGTSIALSYTTGHRHFVSCLPASEALSFPDLDLSALQGHEHLLRADIWFSEAMLFEGNQSLLQIAQKAGLTTSLDINWDPQWGHASGETIRARKDAVRKVLPWVNLAHGNIRELLEFTGAQDLETALKSLIDSGAGAVVIHMGSKGAGYYHEGTLTLEPPSPVSNPIQCTGTGDVLSVSMMLLQARADLSIPQRLRMANEIVAEFMRNELTLIPCLSD